jgi:hypothetical protein
MSTFTRVIPVIFLLTSLCYLHDPLYRGLLDDEQGTWFIVYYSSKVKIFDTSINLFHFVTPFLINILSAFIIIIYTFKSHSKTEIELTRQIILFAEIKRHKYLFTSPCVLIILALPRIIILLMSQYLEPVGNPWLFLTGYYISFVPPLVIIIVFVLPFDKYKIEFLAVIRKKTFDLAIKTTLVRLNYIFASGFPWKLIVQCCCITLYAFVFFVDGHLTFDNKKFDS